jgi:hypothetical protein
MTRLTYTEAMRVAADPAAARPVELIEAARVLRNAVDETPAALDRIRAEMRGRSAFASGSGSFVYGARV